MSNESILPRFVSMPIDHPLCSLLLEIYIYMPPKFRLAASLVFKHKNGHVFQWQREMWLRKGMLVFMWHGTSLRKFQEQFWLLVIISWLTLAPSPLIRHISAEWISFGKWKNEKEVGSFFWYLWICAQTRNFAFSMSVPSYKAHHNLFHHFLNLGYKNGPQTKVWEIEPFKPLLTLSFIKYLQSVNKVSGTEFQNELLLN